MAENREQQKKTSFDKIADGGRFTYADIEEAAGDVELWSNNASARQEQIEALAGLNLSEVLDSASNLSDLGGDFERVLNLLEEAAPFLADCEHIDCVLTEIQDIVGEFSSLAETALDESESRDERAYAKSQLPELAEQIRAAKKELSDYGLDLDAEP